MSSEQPPESSSLRLYNTLTRQKEPFAPIDANNVRLYACGPTVYDLAHIGNARPLIVFDVLFRLLRHRFGAEHVTYVRNITDVDDKINARAAERGISIRELTDETNRIFQNDVRALGCLEPTHQPRATDFVTKPDASIDMIRMIARLIETGHAYEADGHVLFSVPSMPDYGKLSRRPLDEMIAGARVDVAPYKRADTDFVLWKPSKGEEPGWDSPWGFGRPGWHLECSAMSAALLGETFDIHAGGIDLVFPHHENEIAQSRCCFGTPVMANVWMHNGFLQVEGAKMSKSAGNFVTIRELLRGWKGQAWSGAAVRWAVLQTHYRQPIDFTYESLLEARNELARVFLFLREPYRDAENRGSSFFSEVQRDFRPSVQVTDALGDDLNTPLVITRLREQRDEMGRNKTVALQTLRDLMFLGVVAREETKHIFGTASVGIAGPVALRQKISGIGLDLRVAKANFDTTFENQLRDEAAKLGYTVGSCDAYSLAIDYVGDSHEDDIEPLLSARLAARARKDWKESDRIRDELLAMGIALKDNKDGTTTWEVKR